MKVFDIRVDERGFAPILSGEDTEEDQGLVAVEKTRVQRPKKYMVLLHNDDYTTMEFVIFILQSVFGKTFEQAQEVMLTVHNEGTGVCGIYTHEIAESKMAKVLQLAKDNGHPLMCSIEPE